MPGATKNKNSEDVLSQEEVIYGVVVTESFDKTLLPCVLEKPRALIPVANTPVIDYTLGFLSQSGIQHVIIYCNTHAEEIRDYLLRSSNWNEVFSSLKILTNEEAACIGDVLRDLDDKQLIYSDFVLVHGDLVANIDLIQCLQVHKKKREVDKDAILTKVMKKCPPSHRIHDPDSLSLYALNKVTNQILYHQRVSGVSKIKFPMDIIRKEKDIHLRYDLLDCGITICSPVVPSLLTDNFDYQSMNDLIHGVLGNQEILGNTMHIHMVDGYAARLSSHNTYHTVSQDVMERWVHPFTPDAAFYRSKSNRNLHSFGNNYTNHSESFTKQCTLKKNTVIGKNTKIGKDSVISNSVIGDNCSIGGDVVIENCIIWDDVVIEDKCCLYNSVLCGRTRLYRNTTLKPLDANPKGSIRFVLGKEVELGPDITLRQEVMLISSAVEDECDFESGGTKRKAYKYEPPSDDESGISESVSGDFEGDTDSDDDGILVPDTELFYNELMDMIKRVVSEKIGHENIILDVNSLKHAYNIQINEVNHMLIQAVLDYPVVVDKVETPQQMLKTLKPLLKLFEPVFGNYYRSEKSQRECLGAVQEYYMEPEHSLGLPVVAVVLKHLYDNDIVDEDVILDWYKDLPSGSGLQTSVKKLVDWLAEAEEEDSD